MSTVLPQKFPEFLTTKSSAKSLRRPPVSINGQLVESSVEANAAAELLHYSSRSIKQMAPEGRIPAHPFGTGPHKRWYFLTSLG